MLKFLSAFAEDTALKAVAVGRGDLAYVDYPCEYCLVAHDGDYVAPEGECSCRSVVFAPEESKIASTLGAVKGIKLVRVQDGVTIFEHDSTFDSLLHHLYRAFAMSRPGEHWFVTE